MYDYVLTNDELYHWGIKGQKWGVRRYQNKDGSLTPAGKKRYSDEVENAKTAMETARQTYKEADKACNRAYMKYETIPTSKNYENYYASVKELRKARKGYSDAKLNYKVAKYEADGWFENRPKSKHRTLLEEKYRNQGYDEKQAAVLANERIRAEKIVTTTAALTVTACVAYAYHKRVKDRTDQILKSGELLQRIEMQDTGGKLHDVFYASTGDHDNKRYARVLGLTRKQQTGHAYIMKMQTQGDIKVASKDKAASIFGDLYKNDADFRSSVQDSVYKHFGGSNRVNTNDLSDKNIRKMYENFNSALVELNKTGTGADKKFYDRLKSAGYGAIQDINDMKYSGYRAKNPLIIFDNSNSNVMVRSMTELTDSNKLLKGALVELGKAEVEKMSDTLLGPTTAMVVTGTAAGMYVSDHIQSNKETNK